MVMLFCFFVHNLLSNDERVIHINLGLASFKRFILLFILITSILINNALVTLADDEIKTAKKPGQTSPFPDVAPNNPNYIFINYLNQRGIIGCFPDGSYHPQEGLTRAQAAVVMCKSAGLSTPDVNTSEFIDVAVNHWAVKYINASAKAGYLKGFPDGSYQPEAKLTRAQGVSLIMRLCTQKEQAPLPQLKDMTTQHWAADTMGTALALEMIGLSKDSNYIYPDAEMSRGSLARALSILLTKDPGLNKVRLDGKLREVKGKVAVVRSGHSQTIQGDYLIMKGDQIKTGPGSSVRIDYPDGTSNLLEANSEIFVKQSDGTAYIKQDGSKGIAVDYLNLDLKQGTMFSNVATIHLVEEKQSPPGQSTPNDSKTTSRSDQRLAASDRFHHLIAENSESTAQPWYQTAQKKKVKVKVDMPWGVAAIRGTLVKMTVTYQVSQVACYSGTAEFVSNSGEGNAVSAGTNITATVKSESVETAALSKEDVTELGLHQDWAVDTSIEQDINQPATFTATIIVNIPDGGALEETPATVEGIDKTTAVGVLLNVFQENNIPLDKQVAEELMQKIEQVLNKVDEDTAKQLQDQATQVQNQVQGQSDTHNTTTTSGGNSYVPSSAKTITASSYGAVVDGNVAAIPSTTKVSAFKAGLTPSAFATAEILTGHGGSAVANQDTTDMNTAMVIQVTAQDGSKAEYEIYDFVVNTLEDLYNANNAHLAARYILARDLDFNDPGSYADPGANQANWTSGTGWGVNTTYTAFIGLFEGNRHSIGNLLINAAPGLGLFHGFEGGSSVRNLSVRNVNITGGTSERYGALAGYAGLCTISNCYTSGTIYNPDGGAIGGMVGHIDGGQIFGCRSNVNVTGKWGVGGIIGRNNNGGQVQNCYSNGNVQCVVQESAGGIIGWNQSGSITNSYATGLISGNYSGGIVGSNGGPLTNCFALNYSISQQPSTDNGIGRIAGTHGGSFSYTNCFARSDMKLYPASGYTGDNGTDISLAAAKLKTTYSNNGWDIDYMGSNSTSIWVINEGNDFPALRGLGTFSSLKDITAAAYGTLFSGSIIAIPTGTKVDVFKAGLTTSLYSTAEILTSDGFIVQNQTATDMTSAMVIEVTAEDGSKSEYEIYDYAIATLEDLANINNDNDARYLLLHDLDFDNSNSYADAAAHKTAWTTGTGWPANLSFYGLLDGNEHSISNLYTSVNKDATGLFSTISNGGIVRNLRVLDANVKGSSNNQRYGVISGHLGNGKICNCYCSGIVYNPNGGAIGGLVGHDDAGFITGCKADVDVTGYWGTGGILGRNAGGVVQNCYTIGDITCLQSNVGGVVGWNQSGSLSTSYATGTISGPMQVAGLIGFNEATVSSCFALNNSAFIATGSEVSVGRVVGNTGGTISNCYAVSNMTKTPSSGTSGYDSNDISPTDATLMTTYSSNGWNIDLTGSTSSSVWVIQDGVSLPSLRGINWP